MPEQEISIRRVTVKELEDFASRMVGSAAPGGFIPITLHRARAMAHNPFADAEDVALLAAFSGEELIGYFGIMAVRLDDGEAQHKAHWFTTWMVHPRFLGLGVGSMLMQAALELDKDYFIVGSKPARRVCDKFGFERLPLYRYTVLDFGLAGRWNPVSLALRLLRKLVTQFGGKLDIAGAVDRAERVFESLFGWFVRPVLYSLALRLSSRAAMGYRFEKVAQVREVEGASRPDVREPRLVRGVEAVNWMLSYPWVLPPGRSQTQELDFYFSDTRPAFESWALEAHRDGYRGYAAFQFSRTRGRRVLKVLDVESGKADSGWVLLAALQEGSARHAERIEMAPEHAAALHGTWIGRLILRQKERTYQIHPRSSDSPLARVKDRLVLHYTDGDTPFT